MLAVLKVLALVVELKLPTEASPGDRVGLADRPRAEIEDIQLEVSRARLQRFLILADKLGPHLIGEHERDFEVGLLRMWGDERLAEALGVISRFGSEMADDPSLVSKMEHQPGLVSLGAGHAVSQRLLRCVEDSEFQALLEQFEDGESFVKSLPRPPGEELVRLDVGTLGRTALDTVYDPDTPPDVASAVRASARFVARIVAIRRIATRKLSVTDAYAEGLFADAAADLRHIYRVVAPRFGAVDPDLDLRRQNIEAELNEQRREASMDLIDEDATAWRRTFGDD